MKKIVIILLTALASFIFAPSAGAQSINDVIQDTDGSTLEFPKQKANYTIDTEEKIAYRKSISSPLSDGTYWIKLETFATGEAKKVVQSTPSDIILVLDLSSSMYDTYYTLNGERMRRIEALRIVIEDFAKTVYDNDAEARSNDTNYAGDRIAIVGYNRNASMISSGGWVYINDATNGVTKTGNTYSGGLITNIRNMGYSTGTRPDHGLDMAIDQLLDGDPSSKRSNANLTVLLFSDGYPTDNNATQLGEPNSGDRNKFEYPFANKTLYYGSRLKKDFGAKLYTVGLITSVDRADSWQYRNYCRVLQMMDWLSSNYPDSKWDVTPTQLNIESESNNHNYYNGYNDVNTVYKGNNVPTPWRNAWTYSATGDAITLDDFTPGSTTTDGNKFTSEGYCQIVDDDTDFSGIFDSIAKQTAGTANADLGTATSNVDIVSNSFVLPDDLLNATNIKDHVRVFTAKLESVTNYGTANAVYNFATEILAPNSPDKYGTYDEEGNPTGLTDVDDLIDIELEGDNAIKVTQFDYAANFCGPVYKANGTTLDHWNGHKIIIMIPIQMNPDAVGGPNVETNAEGSGIFIPNRTDPVIEFDSPTVSLPVNVYIEKEGLEGRESAKFMIERAIIPDDWDEDVDSITGWEFVSTVFVTNSPNAVRTERGNPMVRVKGMPATKEVLENGVAVQKPLIYKISEEDWSWSYTPKTDPQYTVTDKIENPFYYENDKKTNIDVEVRHAESKVTNIFKPGIADGNKRYDDSKTNTGRESSGPAGLTTGGSN